MRNTRTTRTAACAAAMVGTLIVAGCGADASSDEPAQQATTDCPRTGDPETVTVVDVTGVSLAPGFVADFEGYFEDEGITIKREQIGSSTDTVPLLARGDVDVAVIGLTAGVFNSVEEGLDIKAVASAGQMDAAKPAGGFFVRSDLVDSGTVTDIADLKGMKAGFVGGSGSASAFLSSLVLAEGDLTIADVQEVNLPSYSDSIAAFQSGSIDMGYVATPVTQEVQQSGIAKVIGDQSALAGQQNAAYMMGPSLLADKPDVGVAYVRALLRASQENLRPGHSKDPEFIDSLVDVAELPRDLVTQTPEYVYDENLEFTDESLTAMQDAWTSVDALSYEDTKKVDDLVALDAQRQARESLASCTY